MANCVGYYKGDGTLLGVVVVYGVEERDEKVYFVAKGELVNYVPFDIAKSNKYPVSGDEWETLITTRKMVKGNELYKTGSVFGQLEAAARIPRLSQVKALTDCKLYWITWDAYMNCTRAAEV